MTNTGGEKVFVEEVEEALKRVAGITGAMLAIDVKGKGGCSLNEK